MMRKLLFACLIPIMIYANPDDPNKDYFFCRLNPLWSWSKARAVCESITDDRSKSLVQELDEFIASAHAGNKELPCHNCIAGTIEKIIAAYEESLLYRNLLRAEDIEILKRVKVAARVRDPENRRRGYFESKYKGESKFRGEQKDAHDEATTTLFGMNDRVDAIFKRNDEYVAEAASLPKIVALSSIIIGLGYSIYINYKKELSQAANEIESAGESLYHAAEDHAQNIAHTVGEQAQHVGHTVQQEFQQVKEEIHEDI